MTTGVAEPASDFVVECTGCRHPLAVRRDCAGRAVRCPECRAAFVVPQPELPTEAFDRPDDPPDVSPPDAAGTAGPTFREPVKTLETASGTVVLRRLTPEERSQRRARRTLILMVAGALLLFAFVLLFGR
jgi:ribosomal protein S27E